MLVAEPEVHKECSSARFRNQGQSPKPRAPRFVGGKGEGGRYSTSLNRP